MPESGQFPTVLSGKALLRFFRISRRRDSVTRALSTGLVVAMAVVAGSTIGLLVIPRAPSPPAVRAAPPRVELLGKELQLNDESLQEAKSRLRAVGLRTFSLQLPGGRTESLTVNQWGGASDTARLEQTILDLGDSTSLLRKNWDDWTSTQLHANPGKKPPLLSLPTTLEFDPELAMSELKRIKDKFDQQPRNARLNLTERSIVPEQIGQWLDVDATLFEMDRAIGVGEFSAKARVAKRSPSRRAKNLEGLKFETVLGHFETQYSRTRAAADRTFNLRLAAAKLDGTVLMPGETFDFNEVVGARDEANGYKVATVIANGELVDGIGGGTCQISGTLHGAAFFSGLDIIERYPHTRPSSYIKMGMDATVVYPTINFRFRNPYEFPIAIHETVEDGVVRSEVLGPAQDQVVTLIRKVDRAIPYEQVERNDSTLPQGTSVLAQRGIPGFSLHRYRTIRRGSHTRRERWKDAYPPTPQVIRVGTGGAMLKKGRGVNTPEYRADEVLILTQRRPEGGKPGELVENREKGKYGKLGWTKDAGMPYWDSR